MCKIEEFLQKYRLFDIANTDMVNRISDEMQKGLMGERAALHMIPLYVTPGSGIKHGTAAIIDAGGTNLRTGLVSWDGKGFTLSDYKTFETPGRRESITIDRMFEIFADCLEGIIEKAEAVGFSFSFPAEILPNSDGYLVRPDKELKITEYQNRMLCRGVAESLEKRGKKVPERWVLLNDTSAVLLAATAIDGCFPVGMVLGTGFNINYFEDIKNITKLYWNGSGNKMAINIESGSSCAADGGELDRQLDIASHDTGAMRYEKMVSGAYLGTLASLAFKAAAEEGIFENPQFSKTGFSTKEICEIAEGNFETAKQISENDLIAAKKICMAVVERSGCLAAASAAAVIKRCRDSAKKMPVVIAAEGSLFWGSRLIRSSFEKKLKSLAGDICGEIEIISIKNAVATGCAAAALRINN